MNDDFIRGAHDEREVGWEMGNSVPGDTFRMLISRDSQKREISA